MQFILTKTNKTANNRKISYNELKKDIEFIISELEQKEETKEIKYSLKLLRMPIESFIDRRGILRPFDLHKRSGAVSQDGNTVRSQLVKDVIDIRCLEQERVEFIRGLNK